MGRIFITGDKHGRYDNLKQQLLKAETTMDDVVIILGDHGTLYYGETQDHYKKKIVSKMPATFIMIRGNHDRRPSDPSYKHQKIKVDNALYAGTFYRDCNFPNILYTEEYGWYRFGKKNVFIIGGAYSVDKYRRLKMQKLGFSTYHWFNDEQLSQDERQDALKLILNQQHKTFDIMSHTCPISHIPTECFLSCVDQSTVDHTTEKWLDEIRTQTTWRLWFCGHWHTDKTDGFIRFMYEDLIIYDISEDINESIPK